MQQIIQDQERYKELDQTASIIFKLCQEDKDDKIIGLKKYRLVITKGHGVLECGRQRLKVKTLLLHRCALRKFRVTDGETTCNQITSDRRSKRS